MSEARATIEAAVNAAVDMDKPEFEEALWTTAQKDGREAVAALVESQNGDHVKRWGDTDYYSVPWPETEETLVVQATDDDAWFDPFAEWIYNSWTWNGLGAFLDHEVTEGFTEEFWRNESVVYHATGYDEAARIIMSGGLQPRKSTRGLNNSSVGRAVFASRSSPLGVYGDVHFAIDVAAMGADDYQPHVEREPGITEARQREAIAAMFHVPDFWAEPPHDESADTVIFYDEIPLEYLSLREGTDYDALLAEESSFSATPEDMVAAFREWVESQR